MPTIRELEAGEAGARQKIRDKCEKIQTRLKIVLSSEMFNIKIERNYGWVRDFNGFAFIVERYIDWVAANNVTTCPKCGAGHNALLHNDRVWHQIRPGHWHCRKCGMKNAAVAHQIKGGATMTSSMCDQRYELRQEIRLFPIDE